MLILGYVCVKDDLRPKSLIKEKAKKGRVQNLGYIAGRPTKRTINCILHRFRYIVIILCDVSDIGPLVCKWI